MHKLNDEYEILTPDGFCDFDGIKKMTSNNNLIIEFMYTSITCTHNHIFYLDDNKTILASELSIGDSMPTTYGVDVVRVITKLDGNIDVYDVLEVGNENHYFYASGLISHNCDFIGSVSTLIDHHFLKSLVIKDPLKIPTLPEFIKIWELPRKKDELDTKNWEYVASLDSGYGVYQDNTVLQIFLVKSNITVHQVCTMHSNSMEIEDFCKKARVLLKKYNDPSLIIEQNGPGIAATKYFHSTAEYDNLMHFDPSGRHMGLWASEKLKQNAVILLKTYIQRKFVKLYDEITITELHSFGRITRDKWGGLGGNHDDHITSLYWIPFYLQSPLFYGNIVEVNIKHLEEDELILSSEDEMNSRDRLLQEMSDTAQQHEDLANAAEYISEESGITDDDDDDDGPEESTLFFRR